MAKKSDNQLDDQLAQFSKLMNKDLSKNDFDLVSLPKWVEPIYYILFPAFMVTNMFTNTNFNNLSFYLVLGVAFYLAMRYRKFPRTDAAAPAAENFSWEESSKELSSPKASSTNNPDTNSNVALSDHEESAWDKIVNEFRKPKN